MGKDTAYECIECGHSQTKWFGKCPQCNKFTTAQETNAKKYSPVVSNTNKGSGFKSEVKHIQDVKQEDHPRYTTDIGEIDRVFGGGVVKGSLNLISGEPGIGKSTIILQMANIFCKYGRILYVSAEESEHQIRMRSDRLFNNPPKEVYLLNESNLEIIKDVINKINPKFLIIDSIQTIFLPEVKSTPGSVVQLRDCTFQLMDISKKLNISTFIIGHVTKDGEIAGPKVLEHMVDSVTYFEANELADVRILRSMKNRFGSTNEIGLFTMTHKGLMQVVNYSMHLSTKSDDPKPGSAMIAIMEGTRPIAIEIQSLISNTKYQIPARVSVGLDKNRLNMIIAIIEKSLDIIIGFADIYFNVVSGLKITDASNDLGVAASLLSSMHQINIPQETGFVGELTLTGEIRSVTYLESRVKELIKMGMTTIYLPRINNDLLSQFKDVNLIQVKTVKELSEILFNVKQPTKVKKVK